MLNENNPVHVPPTFQWEYKEPIQLVVLGTNDGWAIQLMKQRTHGGWAISVTEVGQ